jgi:hypothetical protein
MGEKLLGKVVSTWLRGAPVFEEGRFAAAPFGIEV